MLIAKSFAKLKFCSKNLRFYTSSLKYYEVVSLCKQTSNFLYYNFNILCIFNKITVLSEFSSITFSLLNKICTILEKGVSPTDGLFLYGAFFSVLTEFATAEHIERYEQKQNTLVTQCIEYIEKNLTEDLNVEKISREIKFAPSTVAHSFKKQMSISLHKYIVQKRLYFAKTMLDKGYLPTQVYLSCGYTNYSSFYKAYIKMFGKTPKES